jgi:cell division protease FtsH
VTPTTARHVSPDTRRAFLFLGFLDALKLCEVTQWHVSFGLCYTVPTMDFEKMNPLRPREEGKPGLPPPPPPPLWKNSISIFLIFLLFVVGYGLFSGGAKKPVEVSLSEIASDVRDGKVDTIEVEGSKLLAKYEDGAEKISKKEPESGLSETLKNYGVTSEELSAVKVDIKNPSGFGYWLANLAPILIPILFLVILMWYLSRQVKGGGGMQAFSFGQSKARVIYPDDTAQKVTFKDVAGVKEAKEELMEIVDFLKFPKKFLDIGAQIPKGVLLMGAPGTGKTLLARAVAGEAHVPFFHLSGSEFVEMFVGVGASRVRDLFRMVKKEAPAIIFIDEIDAVGRVRGGGVGGGNDEREQTLNQILVEMDGFEPNEKVIVMAATNRPDVLDPALQRPGRFDRRVILELPDLADRKEIIGVHAKKKPLAEDVNLQVVAERTPGFSGADLYSLMNEGAILAARENRKKIGQFDLIRSIEKVMIGPERKSHVLSDKEKRITAYHEGGHALLASLLPYADPVHKISIISRGHAAGYTLKLPLTERRFHTRKEFHDDIVVSLGGYVAELMVFDDLTTGPSNDLQVATNLARSMVARFGMSTEIGPIALESMDGGYLRGASVMERDYSEHVSALIDKEVSKIMNESMEKAKTLLTKHRNVLDAIAEELIAKESLEQKEYEALVKLHGIKLANPMKEETVVVTTHIAPAPSEISISTEAPSIPQATTVTHETVETDSAHNGQRHKKGKR